jgi:hypothetical protein
LAQGAVSKATERDWTQLSAELRGWHLAKEAASRHNRNLLQYGAGIAAVLGIEAGSGGVFAIANGLTKVGGASASLPWWTWVILGGVSIVAGTTFAILVGFLVRAFLLRRAAEQKADDHLAKVIALAPDRFLPREE